MSSIARIFLILLFDSGLSKPDPTKNGEVFFIVWKITFNLSFPPTRDSASSFVIKLAFQITFYGNEYKLNKTHNFKIKLCVINM